jgi:hypothetical protein
MIYTIGHRDSYLEYLSRPEPCMKLGRRGPDDPWNPGYPGGSAWETAADAWSHCPEAYWVFVVEAEWRADTEPSQDGPWDDLLVDSRIVGPVLSRGLLM